MIRLACIFGIIGTIAGWVLAGLGNPNEPNSPKSEPAQSVKPLTAIPKPAETPPAVKKIAENKQRASFTDLADFITNLEQASASDCRRWWKLLKSADLESRQMLLQRWATTDPQGAQAALLQNEELKAFTNTLLSAWAANDVEGALDMALGTEQINNVHYVMENAGPQQIEKLYDLLIERGFDQTSPGRFAGIFHQLAKVDPARAATLALDFKGGSPFHNLGLENVIGGWISSDSVAALAWVKSIEDPAARERAMKTLSHKWLERDPLAAMEALGEKIDFTRSSRAPHSLPTGSMKQADFDQLLTRAAELQTTDSSQGSGLYRAMISGLRNGEHPERLEMLAPHLNFVSQNQLEWSVNEVAKAWTKKDEDGLVDFINTVENETARTAAIRGLVSQLSTDDPLRALKFIADFDEPLNRINVRALMKSAISSGLSPNDLLEQLPPPLRDEAAGTFNRGDNFGLPRADVVEFLSEQPAGPHRTRAMAIVAAEWAADEPQAAASWVDEMEPGNARTNAAGNIAARWATIDIDAAATWAATLEDEKSRSRALTNAARITASTDPLRSLDIASQIKEEKTRDEALAAGLRALARQNPDLALSTAKQYSDAVQSKSLPAIEEARSLRNLLNN